MSAESRSPRRAALVAAMVAVGVVPWLWFVLRDHLGTLGDLLGLGLPVLAIPTLVLLAVTAIWVPGPVVAAWVGSWSLVLALSIFGPRLPASMGVPDQPVRLVTANVRFDNPTPLLAAEDLLATDPEVLVVPEATGPLIDAVGPHFAYRYDVESNDRVYGTAVFSKYELRDPGKVGVGNGVLRVEVEAPRPFVLIAAHLHRPTIRPGDDGYVSHGAHYDEVLGVRAAMDRETLPVVLAGDLNMSDRVRAYRALDRHYTDLARDGFAGTTYIAGIYRLFYLRIDHVFASDGWCSTDVHNVSITGSDHRGIRMQVGPCR